MLNCRCRLQMWIEDGGLDWRRGGRLPGAVEAGRWLAGVRLTGGPEPDPSVLDCGGGIARDVAGAGPQRRDRGHQGRRGVLGEPGPQIIRAGQDQGPGLVDRLGPLGAGQDAAMIVPGDHGC